MTYQIQCPASRQPTYFPEPQHCPESVFEALCLQSRYKYALIPTTVRHFDVRVEAPTLDKRGILQPERHLYSLRLDKRDSTLLSLEFTLSGDVEPFSALPNDQLLLLYSMRGGALQHLLQVDNLTTGQSCRLRKPQTGVLAKALKVAAWTAGITAGLAIALSVGLYYSLNAIPFVLAFLSGSAGGVATYRIYNPKVRDPQELARLQMEQELLARQNALEQKIAALDREAKENQTLLKRLRSLQEQMQAIDETLYANRVTVVARAIRSLQEGQALTQSLASGYRRVVKMLAIEYETSRLAEQLPSDVSDRIGQQLEELEALEDQKEQLEGLVNPHQLLSAIAV